MTNFKNSRKSSFLNLFPEASVNSGNDILTTKSKFNFSYMDFSQEAGQEFKDWNHLQLAKLLDKLHEYSKQPLVYWTHQRVGAGGLKVLAIYEEFPKKSSFVHPKFVPIEVKWARFRLESSVRLIGFVLPKSMHKTIHPSTKEIFDCNTFYVVFLDMNHSFYQN